LLKVGLESGQGVNHPSHGFSKTLANKRVQSDAAAAAGNRAQLGYVTRLELKPISGKTRRG
jgi:hypothetical protein